MTRAVIGDDAVLMIVSLKLIPITKGEEGFIHLRPFSGDQVGATIRNEDLEKYAEFQFH